MKFAYKKIQLWERYGFLRAGIRIHKDLMCWHDSEKELVFVLAYLEKEKKLPKWHKEIKLALADSHSNCAEVFKGNAKIFGKTGKMFAEVVDIKALLKLL